MARKVFVSSDMAHDEKLIDVSDKCPEAALIWPWIVTYFDDWGRAEAQPKRIKAKLFPMNALITVELIEKALNLFAEYNLITLYEVDEKHYMSIDPDKWWKYQTHIHRSKRDNDNSKFPPPPSEQASDTPRDSAELREEPREISPSPSSLPPFLPSPSKEEEDDTRVPAREGSENAERVTSLDPEWTHLFAQVFRGNVNEIIRDEMAQACDEFGVDLVKEAMRRALENADGPPRQYLRGIFDGWREEGIFTMEQLREADAKRKGRNTRASPRRQPRESAAERLLRQEGVI